MRHCAYFDTIFSIFNVDSINRYRNSYVYVFANLLQVVLDFMQNVGYSIICSFGPFNSEGILVISGISA